MAMIFYSLLGILFAAGVFYGARQILKKLEQGEDE